MKPTLLMVSGDTDAARGRDGAFYQMLRWFSDYWARIDVLCPRADGAETRVIHGNVYLHPSPWHVGLQPFYILRQGRRLLQERNYDLVVSHDYGLFYNGIGAWMLTRGSHIPMVSEIHHVEGHPFALTRRELVYRFVAKRYLKWMSKHVAAIRVVNKTELPTFLATLGIPDSKVRILPSMYLDFETFHPMPQVEKKYDVLFVGRLVSNKGIFTILDAVAQVRDTHPNISLCMVGEGGLRDRIAEKVTQLGLTGNVTLIPRVPTAQDLATIYNQARMLVCASTSEGGPRVTVEAMACGVPVISTPVGIMQDLMETGKTYMVFAWHAAPLADKIRTLLDNPLMRERLADNGEIAVQGFRAETIIDQYARGYLELIGR